MRWSVALCDCNATLAWDTARVQAALRLDAPPTRYRCLPGAELRRFVEQLTVSPVDRVLVACCSGEAHLREVAGAAGVDPTGVAVVNARDGCFAVHPDARAANTKAIRLMRDAMATTGSPLSRAPELPVRVGPSVLIATDSRAGLALARRLADVARPIVVLDERSTAFDAETLHPLPWKASWGTVTSVEGSLGAFRVAIRRTQPVDLERCIDCRRCIPVCHTSAITDAVRLRTERCDRCGDCLNECADVGAIRIPREESETLKVDQVVVVTEHGTPAGPRRTGHHVLQRPAAADVEALAWTVLGLVGEFRKPRYVTYDAGTCAGGAAGRQACGRCITACPYDAIARSAEDPLRVRVDQAACEGCGACVSACPTPALRFGEPTAPDLDRRLRTLLAPVPGETDREAPVVAFHCPERGAAALAEAGRVRRPYPATVVPVSVACLRHVSDAMVLRAFALGAAGVALLGCEECPHGERALVAETLETARTILDAFGLGGDRVQLVTGHDVSAIDVLARFAEALPPSPVARRDGEVAAPDARRDAVAHAIRGLVDATGREPGRTRMPAASPFAFPDVQILGCTLCRTCVNVCPTHAFRFDDEANALELRQVACVDCGLCAAACPESVITLRHETFLDRAALDWVRVVQDEPLSCARCGTAFATRRAVEAIEARLLGIAGLADTFAGPRRNLLRMCPRCRAAAAVLEMQKGWEP